MMGLFAIKFGAGVTLANRPELLRSVPFAITLKRCSRSR